jgi:hypothetical protein
VQSIFDRTATLFFIEAFLILLCIMESCERQDRRIFDGNETHNKADNERTTRFPGFCVEVKQKWINI